MRGRDVTHRGPEVEELWDVCGSTPLGFGFRRECRSRAAIRFLAYVNMGPQIWRRHDTDWSTRVLGPNRMTSAPPLSFF